MAHLNSLTTDIFTRAHMTYSFYLQVLITVTKICLRFKFSIYYIYINKTCHYKFPEKYDVMQTWNHHVGIYLEI
jgi:hypothetical protein